MGSTVWLLALVMFVIGSLVFGVCWTIWEHDVQGAFAVAAYRLLWRVCCWDFASFFGLAA